jgi:uncharacterized protein YjiS (DUF1127 family)
MFASLHTAQLATGHVATVGSVPRLLTTLREAIAARRQRQMLLRLDAHLLADIGQTRRSAEIEAGRPIWDLPSAL